MSSYQHKQRLVNLYDIIQSNCGNTSSGTDCKYFSTPDDIFKEELAFGPIEPQPSKPDIYESTKMDNTDEYKGMHVILPSGEGYHRATVSHHMRYLYGTPIGYINTNPLLDTGV